MAATATRAARSTWLARLGLVLGVGLALATVAAHIANRHLPVREALPDEFEPYWLLNASSAVLWTVPGWYLAVKRPRIVFGWLALLAGVAHGLAGVGRELAVADQLGGAHLPLPTLGMWFSAWGPLVEQPVVMAAYGLYPDGRLPRGKARWVVIASIALAAVGALSGAFDPFPGRGATVAALARLRNPVSISGLASVDLVAVLFAPAAIAVVVVLVSRWRRATGEDRRVLSWVVAIAVPTTIVVPIAVVIDEAVLGGTIAQVATLLEVAVIVAATLRHHVYGIDVVLNRTLVYAAVTAVVAGVYAIAVGVGSALGAGGANAPSFFGALAAALLLLPARTRIQRGVNRFLYGERDEPYAVLSRVAAQLGVAGSAEQLLPGLAAATAAALHVPYVAVELLGPNGFHTVATGTPGGPVTRLPLVHQGVPLGALVVGRRPGEPEIPEREHVLLENLARQAAVAAANVRLTEDLRRSRERLVVAQEEERRRLRNDLHDGLGPQLTGIALGLDLVAEGAATDAAAASARAEQLRVELQDAITDVRRLVQGLRPPRLDEGGLPGALEDMVDRARRAGLVIVLRLPEHRPDLPAAVEVAAYRIADEALNNVVRHAGARRCTVELAVDGGLSLTVSDDGRGLNGAVPGIGSTSMRERAEELGGTCTIESASPGCRVVVHLPVRP